MQFLIGFDLFDGFVFQEFEVFLVSGAEGGVAVVEDVFRVGVELFGDVENVLVEDGGVDFLFMLLRFDMLKFDK